MLSWQRRRSTQNGQIVPFKAPGFDILKYFKLFLKVHIHTHRDTHYNSKVKCLVKAMIFPLVTNGCESWTVKKAEGRRIDAFECGVGEDSWESLVLQGDPTSPS